ncbi:MAG: TlpA disulfide reductase family protein [Pirellulaceae bacterium]
MQLEQRTRDTGDLDDADRQKLLEQVAAFAKDHSLGERHLRLASNTVATINRFASAEVREPWFEKFGELFAASEHRTLARYGKRIAAQESSSDIVGQPFELAGVTVAGLPFDVQEYRDHFVVVDFWATWCGPCVRAIPELKSLHETFAEHGVKVVGVSLDEDLEALGKFLEKENLPWTVLAGQGTEDAAKKYKVSGIPTLILVSPEGKIEAVSHSVGDITAALTEKFAAETAELEGA